MEVSKKIANHLLEINAIKLQPNDPFTWASGWKSPIYCDNRKTLSYPHIRTEIKKAFADLIKERFKDAEVIAGVATGAIAHGALVAEELGLPFIYIRSSAKNHGMTNLIEGDFKEGQKVVVIEDLISTGGSSLKAVEALKEAKADVLGMVAIFTYGFDTAEENFNKSDCTVYTLSNYDAMIDTATEMDYIKESQKDTLKDWRKDPSKWGR